MHKDTNLFRMYRTAGTGSLAAARVNAPHRRHSQRAANYGRTAELPRPGAALDRYDHATGAGRRATPPLLAGSAYLPPDPSPPSLPGRRPS